MYKKYLLRCEEFTGEHWECKEYYFDTEDEMVSFAKNCKNEMFKIESAFKLDKLNNDIFS